MRKTFKSKKKNKITFFVYLIILIISLYINIKIFERVDVLDNNFKFNINKESVLLNFGLNYKNNNLFVNKKTETVFNETSYNKKILLYTTHETEEFIDGNIKDAEEYLSLKLKEKDYDVIIDKTNISKEISNNNLSYKDTYKISRKFIEENIDNNTSLIIDLHRDSGVDLKYEDYAKLMFVVGMKHETYKDNYQVSDSINKMIENINPKITRGIYTRESSSYNQDLNGNVILIELGSNKSKISEIKNTIDVLVDAIDAYLGE